MTLLGAYYPLDQLRVSAAVWVPAPGTEHRGLHIGDDDRRFVAPHGGQHLADRPVTKRVQRCEETHVGPARIGGLPGLEQTKGASVNLVQVPINASFERPKYEQYSTLRRIVSGSKEVLTW